MGGRGVPGAGDGVPAPEGRGLGGTRRPRAAPPRPVPSPVLGADRRPGFRRNLLTPGRSYPCPGECGPGNGYLDGTRACDVRPRREADEEGRDYGGEHPAYFWDGNARPLQEAGRHVRVRDRGLNTGERLSIRPASRGPMRRFLIVGHRASTSPE